MSKRTAAPEIPNREVRRFTVDRFELRANDDGTLDFDGYASVFDVDYEMYGGPERYGWIESVDPGAFRKTLSEKPDVQLLLNHDGLPLARTPRATKPGTMTLDDDSNGLRVRAPNLNPADPDVQKLQVKAERGDLDEMSFAFRTIRQEWDEQYERRRLLEVSIHRGDVSVVNYGANPATSFDLRSLLETDPDRVLAEVRSISEGSPELAARIQAALTKITDPKEGREQDPGTEAAGMPVGLARALVDSLDHPAA